MKKKLMKSSPEFNSHYLLLSLWQSGSCLKQADIKKYSETCIKRTVAEVPKSIFLIYGTLNKTFIKRMQTPKKYLKWSFLLLPTFIKRTLVIKFHHSTCQTPEMRKFCHPQILDLFIKKRDLTNLFD